MRWSDINEGLIAVVQGKTTKKLRIPVHKQLKVLLATLEARLRERRGDTGRDLDLRYCHESILLNTRGKPWTPDGFKASWSEQLNKPIMDELRRRQLVFHGLRKSAVVFLLEAGCTDAETTAITGQSRDMVEHYAKQVNQRKLAAAAILKWEEADAAREARKENEDKETGFVQPAPEFVQQSEGGVTQAIENIGAPGKIRTPDPQIRSLVLYPAELPVHLSRGRAGPGSGGSRSIWEAAALRPGKANSMPEAHPTSTGPATGQPPFCGLMRPGCELERRRPRPSRPAPRSGQSR